MTTPALVVITVGGSQLNGWTNMKLERKRNDLTGALTIEMFYSSLPNSPIMRNVAAGAEIQVFVAGNLAFTGSVDARTGNGTGKHNSHHHNKQSLNDRNMTGIDRAGKQPTGAGVHAYADAESYKIVIEARGKTKRLVDSSHDHPTGQMSNTTVPEIYKKLTSNFNIQLNDTSKDSTQIERATFRDGAAVYTELKRWAKEHNLLNFEHVDGKLNLTTDSAAGSGEPLILGINILSFSATQSDGQDNSEVTIKGQRSGMKYHGKEAVMNKIVVKNPNVSDHSPVIHQLNADASQDRLKKRAKFETDRATQNSKQITIDVFSVQSTTGEAWDINVTHYVEIPPEGIFNEFVVDELTYFCDAKGTLKTEMKLVPTAGSGAGGGGGGSPGISDIQSFGQSRAAQAGMNYSAGSYPNPWTIIQTSATVFAGVAQPLPQTPTQLTLPPAILMKLPQGSF